MKIAYGNANFADICRRGAFYVDKPPFLPVVESDELGAFPPCRRGPPTNRKP